MFNVVQIGLKGHQGLCLSEIARRDDAQLVAVWDDDPGALASAKTMPAVTDQTVLTPNLDEVLARRDVQVASLAEDNGSRAAHLIECARRGWHICSEKPLATSRGALDEVRRVLAETKVRLTMLLTMRYEAPYRAMRTALAAGLIGRPLNLSAQKSYKLGQRPAWQRNPQSYGGTIPFIGIHPVDLLHFVTGCDYDRVAAIAYSAGLPGSDTMDESCAVLARTLEGLPLSIRLDFLRPQTAPTHGDDRLRVAGERGVLEVRDGACRLLTPEVDAAQGGERLLELPTALPNLFGEFLDELAGGPTHAISAEEALRATEVVLCAQEAATAGAWVDVPRR